MRFELVEEEGALAGVFSRDSVTTQCLQWFYDFEVVTVSVTGRASQGARRTAGFRSRETTELRCPGASGGRVGSRTV